LIGSVSDCYDNAMCKSFLATLGCELLQRGRYRGQAEAKMAIFDFIEGWHPRRRPPLSDGCLRSTSNGSITGEHDRPNV
jgi:hypothetical protein